MFNASFQRLTAFSRGRAGMAAAEFAFVLPIVLLLMLGGFDLGRFVLATQKIDQAANEMGQMLATNTTGAVTWTDLQFYHDSAMIAFPQVLADAAALGIPWSNDIAITMSSIQFTASSPGCGSNCSYTPQVVWSGGTNPRACGNTIVMQPVSDTAAPTPTTLPKDVFGPGSLLVVDIVYTFHPSFGANYLPAIPIARSVYLTPRYVSLVKYQVVSGDNGIARECPGF